MRLAALCCAALLAATSARAAYRVEVHVDTGPGGDTDEAKTLKDMLQQHLDLARFAKREDLTDDQFKYLVTTAGDQVKALSSTEGYFTPSTTAKVNTKDNQRVVTLDVKTGPRTRISYVLMNITGPITQEQPQRVEQLEKSWGLPEGQPFRQSDWAKAKDDTQYALGKERYHAAKLTFSQARIDPDDHSAELDVEYDSGPTFTLGPLKITGTRRYPADIIRHVNPLHVGEIYSTDRLLELQRQIQKTPYFSNVIVTVPDDPAQADGAPVNVRVSEFPTQRIRTGVGYSTDTGARTQARYSHNNVFGRAWVFTSQLNLEQRRQYGMLDLAMPPDDKAYVNSVHALYDRTLVEGTDQRSMQFGIKRARSLDKYDWAYTLDYYDDQLRPDNGPVSYTHALVPGFSWTRRDVDDPIFPRRGNIISTQVGAAVKGIATDQSFVRLYGRIRQYIPVGRRDLVIARTELGAVLTSGGSSGIPASLLFRAGGTDSIRGYDYQSIGRQQNGSTFPTKFLVTGSMEYQHWLTAQWGGALFWDVGTAADTLRGARLYNGVGVGVRWRSPVGTVNLDLAYGVQERQFRPHISLGVAF